MQPPDSSAPHVGLVALAIILITLPFAASTGPVGAVSTGGAHLLEPAVADPGGSGRLADPPDATTGNLTPPDRTVPNQQPAGSYVLDATWESNAEALAADTWRSIAGIDVVADGRVFVCDAVEARISVIEPDGAVRPFRTYGAQPALAGPGHLAFDDDAGRLYVADPGNESIQVFTGTGDHLASWDVGTSPAGLALAPDGTVVVALPSSGEIRRYSGSGDVLAQWRAVADDGSNEMLRGLHVADDGHVFVIAPSDSSVIEFDPDGRQTAKMRPKLARADLYDLHVAMGPGATSHRLWLAASFGILYHEPSSDYWSTNPVGELAVLAANPAAGIYAGTAGRYGQASQVLRLPFGSGIVAPERRWGATVLRPGVLDGPESIVMGADGRAYILDRSARIQRFSQSGIIDGQIEHPNPVHVDAAADGTVVVTDGGELGAYNAGGESLWSIPLAPPGDEATAVGLGFDQSAMEAVVLDTARGRLRRYGLDGTYRSHSLLPEAPDGSSVWSDLAIDSSGTAYALDRSNLSIAVIASDGSEDEITLDADARRIAVGPGGEIYALARDGWIRYYDATGARRGAFDAARYDYATESSPSDVAVDTAGRIYVADRAANVISRFAWDPQATPGLPPDDGAGQCRSFPDKYAQPISLELGEATTIHLTVRGGCGPGVSADPSDIVLILDRSASMEGDRIRILREAALNFVADVDFGPSRVAVISFNASARRDVGLTADARRVRDAIRSLQAEGETAIHRALELARDEVARRGREDSRSIFILFSDGDSDFDPAFTQADTAKKNGVEIYTIGIQAWQALMRAIASDDDHYFRADSARFLYGIFERIAERVTAATLYRSIRIEDQIAPNMTYILGSADPPATFDGTSLVWDLADVPFGGFGLKYELEPTRAGDWPTNASAWGDYVDGFGQPGRIDFPVPRVTVAESGDATPTPRSTPTVRPTATALPTPSRAPVPIFLPVALNEKCIPGMRHADVVLVMDTSSSMAGQKLAAAKLAALSFVDQLSLPEDQVGIVSFNSSARLVGELTGQPKALADAIASLAVEVGTRIDLGLAVAHEELVGPRSIEDNTAVIVLLTDGVQREEQPALDAALRARTDGVRIFAIGLGEDVDAAFLRQIAGGPRGLYLAPGPDDLSDIYNEVAGVVPCPPEDFWGRR